MFRKTPSRIFINYRRGDAAGFAGRLSDTLSGYFGDAGYSGISAASKAVPISKTSSSRRRSLLMR
jgi:hypothetical protein